MLIQKAFKFRLEPNRKQAEQMAQFAGCARYIWNRALALQQESLKATGKRKSFADLCKLLTQWKQDPECAWLKEAPIHALQQSLKNLDIAYQRFFNKQLQAEEPRFKKKGRRDSFKESDPACFQIKEDAIRLPKIGWVRFRQSRKLEGTQKNVTISKRAEHWFVSIQMELEVDQPVHQSTSTIGVDMGICQFATLSDGRSIAPLNSFRGLEKKLAKAQKKLSRKVKFSNNWKKQKAKITRIHINIADSRQDFLHKISTDLSKNHATVVMENLKVANLSKSAKGTREVPGKNVKAKAGLNKSILDQGWHEFGRQLEYKQAWQGGSVIYVSPRNTSRKCSVCHYIHEGNRTTQEKFLCLQCGHHENADINAAKNILAAGHAVLACGDIRQVVA